MGSGETKIATILATAAALAAAAPSAQGAITLIPGPNTATTSTLEIDFGGSNPDLVESLRWRDSGGTLGSSLVAQGGSGCVPGEALEMWGGAYGSTSNPPSPINSGNTGTWQVVGPRTVQTDTTRPTNCSGDTVSTPVRTRYSFYDAGPAANKVRIQRRFAFDAATPVYGTEGLRPYVARLPIGTYGQVVHPDAAGAALVTEAPTDNTLSTNWNGTWLAINSAATNAGMVILRDPSNTSPAKLLLDFDSSSGSNLSSPSLTKPDGGWKSALTEAEYLCFYDATSWPVASRTPSTLPPGCTPAAVPVNLTKPSIAGTPEVGKQLTGSPGSWESQTGAFSYRWLRCADTCTPIGGANTSTYTPVAADQSRRLRLDVTAESGDGETEVASSELSGVVPTVPPPPGPGTPPGAQPLSVELFISPNPTCTGTSTSFVALASGGSAPVTRYRFEFVGLDGRPEPNREGERLHVISDHTNSTTTWTFGRLIKSSGFLGTTYYRPPRAVKLTATNPGGELATTTAVVHFLDSEYDPFFDPKPDCPAAAPGIDNGFKPPKLFGLTPRSESLTVSLGCASLAWCTGAVTASATTSRALPSRARRRRAVIASKSYRIRRGKKAALRLKLNKGWRQQLRTEKRLKVRVTIDSLAPSGKVRRTNRNVTLGRKPKK